MEQNLTHGTHAIRDQYAITRWGQRQNDKRLSEWLKFITFLHTACFKIDPKVPTKSTVCHVIM